MEGKVFCNMDKFEFIATIVASVLASGGLWTFLTKIFSKNDLKTKMLIGLGHDRIMSLGKMYISRGYITSDEYENLHDYLYEPYQEMGGNGSAKRVMAEVEKLPIKESSKEG